MTQKRRLNNSSNVPKRCLKLKKKLNCVLYRELLEFVLPKGQLFAEREFHCNTTSIPESIGLCRPWSGPGRIRRTSLMPSKKL